MGVKDSVEQARAAEYRLDDGDLIKVEFSEPLTEEELDALEAEYEAKLPADYREMASILGSIECPIEFNLRGNSGGMYHEDLLPKSISIALDGFGNSWEVDLLDSDPDRSAVYYLCHDPPTLIWQCRGIDTFLDEVVKSHQPPYRSDINFVEDEACMKVWQTNPGTMSVQESLTSSDAELRSFAETLDPKALIVDMRNAQLGMGLSWGRFGPKTECFRHGNLPIFAYLEPETEPKKESRFKWLFGKKRS